MGQPYLTLDRVDETLCVRVGKTGEYGYDLFVPRSSLAAWLDRLAVVSEPFDPVRLSLATLDQAALENFFFCVRVLPLLELNPMELQLQWRISRDRRFPGSEVLAAERSAVRRRLTTLVAREPFAAPSQVCLGERVIGQVLHSGWSPLLERSVAWAVLDLPYAVAGVNAYTVALDGRAPLPVETVSPPLVNNLSLHVDRHRHSYKHRRLPPVEVNG